MKPWTYKYFNLNKKRLECQHFTGYTEQLQYYI